MSPAHRLRTPMLPLKAKCRPEEIQNEDVYPNLVPTFADLHQVSRTLSTQNTNHPTNLTYQIPAANPPTLPTCPLTSPPLPSSPISLSLSPNPKPSAFSPTVHPSFSLKSITKETQTTVITQQATIAVQRLSPPHTHSTPFSILRRSQFQPSAAIDAGTIHCSESISYGLPLMPKPCVNWGPISFIASVDDDVTCLYKFAPR